MSEDFIFALLLALAGIAIIAIGGYSAARQKLYYDANNQSVMTEVEIPFLGKLKTNIPAIVLCFIGLVPLYYAQAEMKSRTPPTVKFVGEVAIDPASIGAINAITVGVTSGLWSQTETPDAASPKMNVVIAVPDSWPSYSAYAFAFGGPQTRPAVIGTSLNDRTFKLKIGP